MIRLFILILSIFIFQSQSIAETVFKDLSYPTGKELIKIYCNTDKGKFIPVAKGNKKTCKDKKKCNRIGVGKEGGYVNCDYGLNEKGLNPKHRTVSKDVGERVCIGPRADTSEVGCSKIMQALGTGCKKIGKSWVACKDGFVQYKQWRPEKSACVGKKIDDKMVYGNSLEDPSISDAQLCIGINENPDKVAAYKDECRHVWGIQISCVDGFKEGIEKGKNIEKVKTALENKKAEKELAAKRKQEALEAASCVAAKKSLEKYQDYQNKLCAVKKKDTKKCEKTVKNLNEEYEGLIYEILIFHHNQAVLVDYMQFYHLKNY